MGTPRQGRRRMASLRALSDDALRDRLAVVGNSAKALADQVGVNHLSVWRHLKARGIEWVPDNRRPTLAGMSRAAMYRLYIANGRNVVRMAAALSTNRTTLRRRMRELGFRPRPSSSKALKKALLPVSKELMMLLSVAEQRPAAQVAEILGVKRATVAYYLRRHGIPVPPSQEALRRRRAWSGRPVDIEAERRRLTSRFVDGTVAAAMASLHMRDED